MARPTIDIRPCRVRDIDALLDLWKRSGVVPGRTDRAEAVRRRLARDRQLFLLAWDGDALVGSLIGGWDGWRGGMYRLAVDPGYRRMGIARKLVREVEVRLRRLGVERITCLVFHREAGAAEFWRSVGYTPDAAIQRYVKTLGRRR